MKQMWINVGVFLVVLLFVSHVTAQTAEQYNFLNEMQRRDIFNLDDWVGYGNLRHITWITEDAHRVYFSTWGSGIWRYNKESREWEYPFTTCNGLPENYVSWIYYDESQDLLFAQSYTDEAVFNFTRERWEIKSQLGYWPYQPNTRVVNPGEGKPLSGKFYQRKDLNLTSDIQTESGSFLVLNNWKIQDRNFNQYDINGFFIDDHDNIYFPVENLGLAMGQRYSGLVQLIESGIGDTQPRKLFFNSSAIWIGGKPLNESFSGISRWTNDNRFTLYTARYIFGLYSDDVYDINGSDSLIAFATQLGLSLFHEKTGEWSSYDQRDGLPDDEIRSVFRDDTVIWTGGVTGLGRFSLNKKRGQTWQAEMFSNQTINDFAANDTFIFMATDVGLFRKKKNASYWVPEEIQYLKSKLFIRTVAVDDSTLWIAGDGGIATWNMKRKKWEYFPGISDQFAGEIRDLQIYPGGVAASTDRGLLVYERKKDRWRLYTTNDGLLHNNVFGMVYENGSLWMATPSGICQFQISRHHE